MQKEEISLALEKAKKSLEQVNEQLGEKTRELEKIERMIEAKTQQLDVFEKKKTEILKANQLIMSQVEKQNKAFAEQGYISPVKEPSIEKNEDKKEQIPQAKMILDLQTEKQKLEKLILQLQISQTEKKNK